jgi:hypothetical protein
MELVELLAQGVHAIEIVVWPSKNVEALRQAIERRYVHVRFLNTRGGTQIGVRVDEKLSDCQQSDFAGTSGEVRLVGNATLNYVNVRCETLVRLPSLQGEGYLTVIGEPGIEGSIDSE